MMPACAALPSVDLVDQNVLIAPESDSLQFDLPNPNPSRLFKCAVRTPSPSAHLRYSPEPRRTQHISNTSQAKTQRSACRDAAPSSQETQPYPVITKKQPSCIDSDADKKKVVLATGETLYEITDQPPLTKPAGKPTDDLTTLVGNRAGGTARACQPQFTTKPVDKPTDDLTKPVVGDK